MNRVTTHRLWAAGLVCVGFWAVGATQGADDDGWQPEDDNGSAVARVRLFFHFVLNSDPKDAVQTAKPDAAMDQYVQEMVTGLEYAVPGQPRQFLGGANKRFHATGIQFDVMGTDVVLVPKKAVQAGDYQAIKKYGKRIGCINVYLADRIADHRGNLSGVSLTGEGCVFVQVLPQPGVRGWILAHELGHYLGLPHTSNHGSWIMGGTTPPVVKLSDKPVTGGEFTPSQIKIMKSHIPQSALAPPLQKPTIQSVTASLTTATRSGQTITLTANGVRAPVGATIKHVRFYLDSDRNGVFNPAADKCVGMDTSSAGGWTIQLASSALAGCDRIFACAEDTQRRQSYAPSVVVALAVTPSPGIMGTGVTGTGIAGTPYSSGGLRRTP